MPCLSLRKVLPLLGYWVLPWSKETHHVERAWNTAERIHLKLTRISPWRVLVISSPRCRFIPKLYPKKLFIREPFVIFKPTMGIFPTRFCNHWFQDAYYLTTIQLPQKQSMIQNFPKMYVANIQVASEDVCQRRFHTSPEAEQLALGRVVVSRRQNSHTPFTYRPLGNTLPLLTIITKTERRRQVGKGTQHVLQGDRMVMEQTDQWPCWISALLRSSRHIPLGAACPVRKYIFLPL